MMPWVGLQGRADGNVTPCCEIGTNGILGDLSKNTLEDIWNSETMRKLRLEMLADRRPSMCFMCHNKDDAGLRSLRRSINEHYLGRYRDVVDSTTDAGYVEKLNLVHWDFRFSNLCNLKCRSCVHTKSSTWYDDAAELSDDPEAFRKATPRLLQMVQAPANFWPYIEKTIGIVERIHWLGGEPLIIDEHWRVLAMLREAKREDVRLRYFTNLTHLTYRGRDVLTEWERFTFPPSVAVSLDGMGKAFQFLRSGGKWNAVEKNLRRLYDHRHVKMNVAPVVSVMNAFAIMDLNRYLLTNDIVPARIKAAMETYYTDYLALNVVTYPRHLSLRILPPRIKERLAEHWDAHAAWAHENYGTARDGLANLTAYMMAVDWQHELPRFHAYTRKLDTLRGESFYDAFPEWRDLL